MEAVGRSMALDEPFSFAANFMASAIEQVINPALLKALRQEVAYDTGFFENISKSDSGHHGQAPRRPPDRQQDHVPMNSMATHRRGMSAPASP